MANQLQKQPPQSFRQRRWKLLLAAALALIELAGLAGCGPQGAASPIAEARQQTARQALLSPSGAMLHLGHYGDITRWEAPLPTDFAVQDGMVLFPEDNTAAVHDRLGIPPIVFPVLVYAPDGGDLSTQPGPPTDRYIASNEWFLVKCRPVPYSPNWWECGLLFGDAVQQ